MLTEKAYQSKEQVAIARGILKNHFPTVYVNLIIKRLQKYHIRHLRAQLTKDMKLTAIYHRMNTYLTPEGSEFFHDLFTYAVKSDRPLPSIPGRKKVIPRYFARSIEGCHSHIEDRKRGVTIAEKMTVRMARRVAKLLNRDEGLV